MSAHKKVVSGLAVTLLVLTTIVAPSRADAATLFPRIVKIESGQLTVTDVWDDDTPAPPPTVAFTRFGEHWWLSKPSSAASTTVSRCAGSVKGTVIITAARSHEPEAEDVWVSVIATLYRTTADCFEAKQLNSKTYSAWIEAGDTRNVNIPLGASGTYDHLHAKFTIKNTTLGITIDPPPSP